MRVCGAVGQSDELGECVGPLGTAEEGGVTSGLVEVGCPGEKAGDEGRWR